MNFSAVHRLLEPALEAFPAPDLENIRLISELRNSVTHSDHLSEVTYKGRSPFVDADCMAQVYFEGWAVRKELDHFHERMIEDPQARAMLYQEAYRKSFDSENAAVDDDG